MDFLQVKGRSIVAEDGSEIRLRGANIGAWMNLENFLNGYPSSESALRHEFKKRLGEERAAYFFDRLLDAMFSEKDVEFLKNAGMNLLRIPVNYRHFESDMEPFRYKEEAFRRLDRALEWCEKHQIYAIIDMHTAPGFQGPDWHSDNSSQRAFFWEQIHFQDRFVALWEEFARRYKDRSIVAGYDLLNEPISNATFGRFPSPYKSDWDVINRVYRRTVEAIRRIDPKHIIVLEGDYLGFYFAGFEAPFADNLVYSSHLYPVPAIREGEYPGMMDGQMWDKAKLQAEFFNSEGARFAREHNVPLWVGEFGVSYSRVGEEDSRSRALADMIEAFEEYGAHWTVWTFKDIGHMGLLQIDPKSEYAAKIKPIFQAEYQFTRDGGEGRRRVFELADFMQEQIGDPDIDRDLNRYLLEMSVKENYLHLLLLPSYARIFENLSPKETDDILGAFSLDRCIRHDAFEVVRRYL
ncbi:glycoside hydrolase family 5 protein [Cohnella caldifontis]|uniref:glycoside hydrolase family 5 protein n=1 Tax=Cohnella caldifontis TaxID=3027471 RepID=UPI0023EC4ABE|nr:glycoside hydrolase family 5 protein [Cohnella sp. YIM B05605]